MTRFVYKKRTPDQFRSVMNRKGGGFDSYIKRDFKRYKMRDGKNVLRFLPPTWEDADHFALEVFLNYDIGPDETSYLSLSKMGKGKDPLAEARQEATAKGDAELAKLLTPSRRWVAWVIDRFDQASEAEGPQVFDFPVRLNSAICTASQDEDTNEIIYVDDPKEGADVRFYKEGKGKTGTSYPGEKIKVLKPSPLSDDASEAVAWLEYVSEHPIPECLQFYSYDHISATFNGAAKASADEEDADESEKQPSHRAATKPPWDEETGEVEEDTPPRQRPGAATKPAKAEAEPEDDSGSIRDRLRRRRERAQSETD